MKAIVAAGIVAALLFAGCSNPPPSGSLRAADYHLDVTGTANPVFVAYNNPIDDTVPAGPDPGVCPQPPAPETVQCTNASTTITAELQQPPQPSSEAYRAYLVGTAEEVELGAFIPDEQNFMYDLQFTRAEDLSEGHSLIQVRVGEFVFAEAAISPSGAPAQFMVAQSATTTAASGTYEGDKLTVTVDGLPPGNVSFMGIFYELGDDGVPVASEESCPIVAGANLCRLSAGNVADFVQFHVHVAGSKINLVKMNIGDYVEGPAATA